METGTDHPGSTWTQWTSKQGWNQEDQHPGGVETEISTGLEECERQQRLHRYSSNKRETKDRVSSLLGRGGEEELMKCTEKREVLIAFFASVFFGKISSQVSHTPEATVWGRKHCLESDKLGTKCMYKQGNICICDLQEQTNVTPFWLSGVAPQGQEKNKCHKAQLRTLGKLRGNSS